MTPALKAMVEAMAAEIERQILRQMDTGPGEYPGVEIEDGGLVVFENTGAFYLEQVARAGLEAIRDPSPEMSTAGKHAIKGAADLIEREQAECAFRVMIDAILEKP